ncbi:HlyD family secretion protein [Janthinobacterium sp.]|uniref:HlyD family secretion protein n=1 Tax=Janthinobacterium sp. TaxID=1871054 RepID=UPI00293D28D8|nr:HlyD family efflux transporter periplasmic adaptor subunit [Janthinobacterium sp.]
MAPVQPLFRKQAVEHASTRQFGTVLLTRAVSHNVLTMLFVALALSIVLFFALFSTTRKSQCQGVLLPTGGVIRVIPGQVGVVVETRVKEGQSVRAGDVLFVLSGERSSSSADSTQKTVSLLIRNRRDSFDAELRQAGQQSRQRIAAAQRRALDLAEETTRIDSQIALQQHRVSLAEQAQKRYGDLQATNYISTAQLQDKQAELLDQRQRLADLQRAKSVSQRELASAEADGRDLALQAQRDAGALERNVAALSQDLTENEARREILVRAQQDGMVAAITTETGQTVAANAVLASLLPAGAELEAEIYASSRSAGFVKPGMTVLLRYQAYPYQKFGQYAARVYEVANTSLRPDELNLPGASSGAAAEPLYRIRLKLDKQTVLAYGKTMPLKSGMLVDASVLLEQRRLYEWILEPLFSISGRI